MKSYQPVPKPKIVEPDAPPRRLKLDLFKTEDLYAIYTLSEDNSCLIHAILRAIRKDYSELSRLEKIKLAQELRRQIADHLQEIDPTTGETFYAGMFNGRIIEMSKVVPDYRLDHIVGELLSHTFLDHHLQEIISNMIQKDIYFISGSSGDVFIDTKEIYPLCYKGRDSIIVYHSEKHYETVGSVRTPTTFFTVFRPDDELIQILNFRLREKIKRL